MFIVHILIIGLESVIEKERMNKMKSCRKSVRIPYADAMNEEPFVQKWLSQLGLQTEALWSY